jgi:hypothetical protein
MSSASSESELYMATFIAVCNLRIKRVDEWITDWCTSLQDDLQRVCSLVFHKKACLQRSSSLISFHDISFFNSILFYGTLRLSFQV